MIMPTHEGSLLYQTVFKTEAYTMASPYSSYCLDVITEQAILDPYNCICIAIRVVRSYYQ